MGSSKPASTHVPGQYLGYSLQPTRCLARLLDAPSGSYVSIEVFEDVGVEHSDGTRVAEQDKSSADDSNPVSDRAKDLWKTLSNWVDAVRSGEFDPAKTFFEIYVAQPKSGKIAESFSNAADVREAKETVLSARTNLWGKYPSFPLRNNVAEGIAYYVKNVFEPETDSLCKIVAAFTLKVGTGSPHGELEERMRQGFTPEDLLEDALRFALGWVKKETDILLEKGLPAIVSVDQFRNALTSYIRKHDRRTILTTYAGMPSRDEIDSHLAGRTYVRQLQIIDSAQEDIDEAVIDFLRAAVDRTHWSRRGDVDEQSLDEYEHGLKRAWRNYRRKVRGHSLGVPLPACSSGQMLYSECSLHSAQVAGLSVPDHFTPGSFHALADCIEIGWHPDFETVLLQPTQDENTDLGK